MTDLQRIPSQHAVLNQALRRIITEIEAGLAHGFFEFNVTCEIVNQGRRRLTFRAGKSHQFMVPLEECVLQTAIATSEPGAFSNHIKETRGIVSTTSTRQAPLGSGRELQVAHAERE